LAATVTTIRLYNYLLLVVCRLYFSLPGCSFAAMDVKKIVGRNLRKLRVEREMTIEDLAGEAEAETSWTARIERGMVNVSVDQLARYAKVLKVKVVDLFVEPAPGSAVPKPLKAGRRPSRSPARVRSR
jgi:DNA-binding XRE family transcriptional regulator